MFTTNKSVLLPNEQRVVKHQPWYRERLKEKYLAKDKLKRERIIDPKQWTFIKDGLDDFRDGLPPPHEHLFLRPVHRGPAPMLKNDAADARGIKRNVLSPSARFTQDQLYYSRKLPMAEAKMQNIERLIDNLGSHPLSLYEHFEQSLPPELYNEVLEILDPEFKNSARTAAATATEKQLNENSGESLSEVKYDELSFRKNIREEVGKLEERLKEVKLEKSKEEETKNQKNLYKWVIRKEEVKDKANASKLKSNDSEQIKADNIDNHIKEVTGEFCDWIKSLGGEHNIDQVTLTSLFASGYDTKPPLSVPIHVVELSNIPAELRPQAFVPPQPVPGGGSKQGVDASERSVFRDAKAKGGQHQQQSKRFGAWYLPKEQWTLMPAEEKLVDPKLKNDPEKEESKRRVEEMNVRLAPLHGSQAFKAFVTTKHPGRVPKLLTELDEWQKEQIEKQQAAQLAAQQATAAAASESNNNKNTD
jgi:hypothetical protein